MSIGKVQAFELAYAFVSRYFDLTAKGDEIAIDEETSRETDSGWLITYNSKLFLETGDFNKMLVGNKPVLVNSDGQVDFVDLE